MSTYIGDFLAGATVRHAWPSNDSNGASITRSTNGTIAVWKDGGATQSTTGVTDTEDFDSFTGIHAVEIDTTSDTTFYTRGSDFWVMLTGATIDTRAVNTPLFTFSIQNRYVPGLVARGTAQAGSSTTVQLPSGFAYGDDILNGGIVAITGGTGAGQSRPIDDYVGATDTATISPQWATNPDNTSTVEVFATAPASTSNLPDVNVSKFGGTTVTGRDIGLSVLISSGTGTGQLSVTSGVIDANATKMSGTALTARDIGASVLLSSGTGTGQVSLSSGVVSANATQISGDSTAADNLEAALDGTGGVTITAALTGNITGNLTGNITGNLSGSVGSVTGNLGGNVVGTVSITSVALSAAGVDSIFDEVVEGSYTLRHMLRGFSSALLAKSSGQSTTIPVFRDLGDTKNRIVATVDANNNRTAVTLDLT